MGREEMPSLPEAGGRAGPEAIRVGKLSLPLTSCCTWESSSHTSPGQHTRVGPYGPGGESYHEEKKAGEPACTLLIAVRNELAGAVLEAHTGSEDGELAG